MSLYPLQVHPDQQNMPLYPLQVHAHCTVSTWPVCRGAQGNLTAYSIESVFNIDMYSLFFVNKELLSHRSLSNLASIVNFVKDKKQMSKTTRRKTSGPNT